METKICKSLSLFDTSVLKGVALILLLCHHLFFQNTDLYNDFYLMGHGLVQKFGLWSKVCVAIFVFLSGYGLTTQTKKKGGVESLKKYYWHRFTKLYANYWFIWLLFVPIGLIVFNRTFSNAYEDWVSLKLILDFFGIINAFGWYGYNATWWFYSCIILLYIIFPFLYNSYQKDVLLTTLIVIIACFLPIPLFDNAKLYIVSFYMGIVYCMYNNTPPTNTLMVSCRINKWLLLLLVCIASVERMLIRESIFFDSILVTLLVLLYNFFRLSKPFTILLAFLGRHSMDIFLFHTFIYSHWFKAEIYASRNPVIIFLTLLVVCVIISLILEQIKKLLRINNLINKVDAFVK